MNRWPLVAIKDFEFKGKSYATGDRFDLPIGEAYKVISRRQAKRATATSAPHAITSDVAELLAASDEALSSAQSQVVESLARSVDAEMMADAEPAPEAESEPPAEEENPRRRRRRQSSYEAEGLPHESRESEWNSE